LLIRSKVSALKTRRDEAIVDTNNSIVRTSFAITLFVGLCGAAAVSDGRGWTGLIGIFSFLLAVYCAVEVLVWQAPKANTTTEEKAPAGDEIQPRNPIKSSTNPSKSLLGREDAEILIDRGYHLIEYPTFNRWQKRLPPGAEPFSETEVLIAEEGEIIIDASVFNIHRDCSWKPGSAATLTFENGSICDLERVLKGPKYQRRLSLAHNIAFIGLQSHPLLQEPYVCESHETLSECRFVELATRTRKAMPDEWAGRQRWGFDLGRANNADDSYEFDQRRALVVGIRERRSEVDEKSAISRVVLSTKIGLVDLSDYEFSNTAIAVRLRAASGQKTRHK
jgi:hypothetical protein